jgi:hypothetical protein
VCVRVCERERRESEEKGRGKSMYAKRDGAIEAG